MEKLNELYKSFKQKHCESSSDSSNSSYLEDYQLPIEIKQEKY